MARGFIRPEVPSSLYEEMTAGRTILINPGQDDLIAALTEIQKRTRARRIEQSDLLKAWQKFNAETLPQIGLAGATEAPAHYRWPLQATVFQAIRITRSLNGVILNRVAIPPGCPLKWPVPPDAKGTERAHAIVTAFWLHLSDKEITQVLP